MVCRGNSYHIELDAREVVEGAVMVLRLEAEVPLHVDLDFGQGPIQVFAKYLNVLLDQKELAVRLCGVTLFKTSI